MKIIDTTKELKSICKILKKQKVVAIDCEFIREKTYYPIPCLIQVFKISCISTALIPNP